MARVVWKAVGRSPRLWLAVSVAPITLIHSNTPAGPPGWHAVHIIAAKLYYVPIVLAAAWATPGFLVLLTTAIAVLSAAHIVRDWAGQPMLQADQWSEILTYWGVAAVTGVLFRRERLALVGLAVAHRDTLGALARTLEAREPYTAGHSRRVRRYSLRIARAMGLRDGKALAAIGQGALLHDIGKIGVPDRVLLKEGPLDEDEWTLLKAHPLTGASLIGTIDFLAGARDLVVAHHERYDGSGYPAGLLAEEIPLGARIFAVADMYDALTTDRPYRRAVSHDGAAGLIGAERGRTLDPVVVDAFLGLSADELAEERLGDAER